MILKVNQREKTDHYRNDSWLLNNFGIKQNNKVLKKYSSEYLKSIIQNTEEAILEIILYMLFLFCDLHV